MLQYTDVSVPLDSGLLISQPGSQPAWPGCLPGCPAGGWVLSTCALRTPAVHAVRVGQK